MSRGIDARNRQRRIQTSIQITIGGNGNHTDELPLLLVNPLEYILASADENEPLLWTDPAP